MTNVLESIRADIRREGRATAEMLARIDQAIREEPKNAALWVLRGDAIRQNDDLTNPLAEVERSYRKSIEIDAKFAAGYESLGCFWLDVMENAARAKPFFEEAVRLGAGASAQKSLERVVAQMRSGAAPPQTV